MELKLNQTQSQKIILAPQLRQFLKLLELPVMELEQKVEEELAQNPVLEEVQPNPSEEPLEGETDGQIDRKNDERVQDILEALKTSKEMLADEFASDLSQNDLEDVQLKRNYQETLLTKPPTLADYLEWQLAFLDLSEEEKKIAREIIGNIDEDGRLRATVEELAEATKASPAQVSAVLEAIQTLDPPGIGGRDLQETLLIQLKKTSGDAAALAREILEKHFAVFERKQMDALARTLNTTHEKIKMAYQLIARLEPKPGLVFNQTEPSFITPEATVSLHPEEENALTVEFHHERIPELRINSMYRQLARDKKADPKTKEFLRQKIQSGLDLIRALAQRKSTLRQITEELMRVQQDFFLKGFAHMKPLRLKDIAEKIHVHESTVSRATSGKYIATPQGTIPYKSFFSAKLENSDGASESQASALERLKHLIAAEDKRKPLSDAKLMKLLEENGIKIARRTVAKYREMLKTLPAHLRKNR